VTYPSLARVCQALHEEMSSLRAFGREVCRPGELNGRRLEAHFRAAAGVAPGSGLQSRKAVG